MAVATATASLDLRITDEQKDLIRRAAAVSGQTITDFVMNTVEPTAKVLVERQHNIELSRSAWNAFVEMMESEPIVTDLARKEALEYVATFGMPRVPA